MSLFEYQPPTALAGTYHQCDNDVPLTWIASVINELVLFTTPGTHTFVPVQGFTTMTPQVIGGGGGGTAGAVQNNSGNSSGEGGGGGGGGGFGSATYPIDTVTLIVGAGGAGGVAQTAANGTFHHSLIASNGGDSSFGAFITAHGGAGGYTPATGGAPAPGGTATVSGGSGAVTSTGAAGGLYDSAGPFNISPGNSTLGGGGGGYGGPTNGTNTVGTAGGTSGSGAVAGGAVGVNVFLTSGSTPNPIVAPAGSAGNAATVSQVFGIGGGSGGGGGGGASGGINHVLEMPSVSGAGGAGGGFGGGGGAAGMSTTYSAATAAIGSVGGRGANGAVAVLLGNPTLPLTGYRIRRDGEIIGEVGLVTAFTDTDPQQGVHTYTVEALSTETAISDVSNTVTVSILIELQGQAAGNAGSDALLTWTPMNCADTQFEIFQDGGTEPIATLPQNSVDGFVVMHLNPDTEYCFYVVGDVSGTSNGVTVTTGCRGVEIFNCDCSIEPVYQTLAEMRFRMMVRMGYPNQASNPPAGMSALIDAFLYDAQKLIWKQLSRAGLNVERFFRWVMVPGQRYYGIDQNADRCDLKLDPYKVTWAGFEDLNRAWYRLTEGVPPEYYTRANINFGWPTHYEIRSCIEIFPAPQAPYTLWIKGDFGLAPLVADGDTATIDDEAVFMLALGNAKAHYGQRDASSVLAQADTYIRGLVAGLHGTRRYVPRTTVQNPATPPRFLPLGDAQA